LSRARGSSSRAFDDEQPDVHEDDAEEKRRNDALAIELASGSPAVIYLREISRARLLTADEEAADERTRHLRFDINLLAGRLMGATGWLARNPDTVKLTIGYFGASTGAGAA